jgi:hypothetical protein
VNFLIGLLGQYETDKVLEKYNLASADFWTGSTVFWQIDTNE